MAANQDIQFVSAPNICSWRELTVGGVYEVLFVEDRGLDKYNKPSYGLDVRRVDTGALFSFYAPASLAFVLKRRTSARWIRYDGVAQSPGGYETPHFSYA